MTVWPTAYVAAFGMVAVKTDEQVTSYDLQLQPLCKIPTAALS